MHRQWISMWGSSVSTLEGGITGDETVGRTRLIWAAYTAIWTHDDVWIHAAAKGHTDLSGLHCHLRLWWCSDPNCCWGLCLGPWPYCSPVCSLYWSLKPCWCPGPMLPPWHTDVSGLYCLLRPTWCPWFSLSLGAVSESMVCSVARKHVKAYDLCSCQL